MGFPDPDRKAVRARLIAAREALSVEARRSMTSAIERHLLPLLMRLDPASLGFCWPYRAEPDLTELIAHWLVSSPSRRAALPVVTTPDAPLIFREWRPGLRLLPDQFGIPTPIDTPVLDPAVVLVPVNGFDARGFRLGYGGGFFDRTLAAMRPAPMTIGVGYELGRVASISPEPHDLPLDWIVTEAGVVVSPGGT